MPVKLSKAVIKIWGDELPSAIQFLAERLGQRGFTGPFDLKEKYFFSFNTDTCETVRLRLGFSRFGMEGGAGLFDSRIVVLSKTLSQRSRIDDPWWAPPSGDSLHDGYTLCLVDSLAHRKWAEQERRDNPAWRMTLDPAMPAHLSQWLDDFDRHHMPLVRSLDSDAALIRTMEAALKYRRPAWVKSEGPHAIRLSERLAAFARPNPTSGFP